MFRCQPDHLLESLVLVEPETLDVVLADKGVRAVIYKELHAGHLFCYLVLCACVCSIYTVDLDQFLD